LRRLGPYATRADLAFQGVDVRTFERRLRQPRAARLKQHLIARDEWSEKQHQELHAELDAQVLAAWKEAVSYGALNEGPRLDRHLMFEDVYRDFPENLRRQSEQLAQEIKLNAELGLKGAE
jgi:TPP-dependent pyruvate/acetoin dehydrogenase alpha subunit